MQNRNIKLTREELYEKVWSMPASKLSKEFGISDVALGKICKKLKIPKPNRGYWQQLAAGHCVQKEKLPPIKKGEPAMAYIDPHQPVARFKPEKPEILAQVELEKQTANKITVSKTLNNPHPLVRYTKEALEKNKPDYYGMLFRRQLQRCLNVRVSKTELHRALRIMDALLKTLEARGYSAEVSKDGTAYTYILIGAEKVCVRLSEKSIGSKRELTTVKKQQPSDTASTGLVYRPSGKLTFEIDDYVEGFQNKWTDKEGKPLEEQLNEILTGLILAGEALRLKSIKREEEQRRWLEQELRRLEEEERCYYLDQHCDAWSKSQRLREFLRAREASLIEQRGELVPSSPEAKWLSWAHQYADQIDPLKNGSFEGSILRLIIKAESP
jgi:hypothetical protein